jgi:glycosyltransferase involved in cell wall biosynthesis
MKIGIENSNARGGGGNIYLSELLKHANPKIDKFDSITLWSNPAVLNFIEDHSWLKKIPTPFNSTAINSLSNVFRDQFKKEKCDILFTPGGTYLGRFRPFVSMAQNMLPFETREIYRYRSASWILKFLLLRILQLNTFKHANGLIYVSNDSKSKISKLFHNEFQTAKVVYHGINKEFQKTPRPLKKDNEYSIKRPYKVLYVSSIAPYKHQWNVIQALWELRQQKFPLELELVGGTRNKVKEFHEALNRYDPVQEWVKVINDVAHEQMPAIYDLADIFVFASSCESFSMITLEAMAAGLPIASSNKGAMPELLGEGAIYFDPENPTEIAQAIETLILSPELRETLAWRVFNRAKEFSWERCTRATFSFIIDVGMAFSE